MEITFPADRDDYLSALSRVRWHRELAGACRLLRGELEVLDLRSLPAPGSGSALASVATSVPGAWIFPMDTGAAEEPLRWQPPPVSTLREFESACGAPDSGWIELSAAP